MEGGIVTTDNKELYRIMLFLRSHGWTCNMPSENKVIGIKSNDTFEESFKFVLPDYNLKLLEMLGALGLEYIKKLPTLFEGRRNNSKLSFVKLCNHPFFQ